MQAPIVQAGKKMYICKKEECDSYKMDKLFCFKKTSSCNNNKEKNMIVVNAEYIGDFSIKVFFSDNTDKVVNIGDFIRKHPHPQYNKYLQEKNFKKFNIESGNVVWGKNWDLIFPIEQLYNGRVV